MDDIEELLAFGRRHGPAALLDHLGLDELGNEVSNPHEKPEARERVRELEALCHHYREALEEIANQDFRGNRSHESTLAFRALRAARGRLA